VKKFEDIGFIIFYFIIIYKYERYVRVGKYLLLESEPDVEEVAEFGEGGLIGSAELCTGWLLRCEGSVARVSLALLSAVKAAGRPGCEGGDAGGLGEEEEVLEVFVTTSIIFKVNDVED